MSVHGAIEERVRQLVLDALTPLLERLEALEKRLQDPEVQVGSAAPVQYASGGFISGPGSRAVNPTDEPERVVLLDEPEPEPLPEHTDPDQPKPARKRAPRKPSAPDA